MSDSGSKSHGDNFLHLNEDIKVSINSVREMMVLLSSKKHPGGPLKHAENEARCRIWKDRAWMEATGNKYQ